MTMSSSEDDRHSERSRSNGWNYPWHSLQIIAWVVIIYFVIIQYGCFIPSLIPGTDIALYCVTTICATGLVITMFVATSLDPAISAVREKGGNKKVPKLDRTKHKHAIEDKFCALCEVSIQDPKAKHCSACNKCVAGFDHHCRWLNNCVGNRNYKWFFATLIFAIVASLLVSCVGVTLFVGYFSDKSSGQVFRVYRDANGTNTQASMLMFRQPVADAVFLTFDVITVVLALIAFGFLVHLTQFHIWLMYKGLSTYDFIIREREKSSANSVEIPAPKTQPRKANKVTPSILEHGDKELSRSEEDMKHRQGTLEVSDAIERGETPPPFASPIRGVEASSQFHKNGHAGQPSYGMKKPVPHQKGIAVLSSADFQCHTESVSPSTHSNLRGEKTLAAHNDDYRPASLSALKDCPGLFSPTPVLMTNWQQEVPPLDLSRLKESVESTNSYQPYSGTSRSCDTYRISGNHYVRTHIQTVPESCPDTVF